jgi:hypothetical protein
MMQKVTVVSVAAGWPLPLILHKSPFKKVYGDLYFQGWALVTL